MSDTTTRPPTRNDRDSMPLTNPQLPGIAPALAAVVAFVVLKKKGHFSTHTHG